MTCIIMLNMDMVKILKHTPLKSKSETIIRQCLSQPVCLSYLGVVRVKMSVGLS